MPHKCTTCDALYDDDAEVVIAGCACGSKVFQYVKQNGTIIETEDGVFAVNVRKLLDGEEPDGRDVHEIDVKGMLRETLKRRRS